MQVKKREKYKQQGQEKGGEANTQRKRGRVREREGLRGNELLTERIIQADKCTHACNFLSDHRPAESLALCTEWTHWHFGSSCEQLQQRPSNSNVSVQVCVSLYV